jgi:outer membrane biosynthesis protein TonB
VTLSFEGDEECAVDFDDVDEGDASVGFFYESRASADRPFERTPIMSGGGGGGQSRLAQLRERLRLMKQERETVFGGIGAYLQGKGKGKGKGKGAGGQWRPGASQSPGFSQADLEDSDSLLGRTLMTRSMKKPAGAAQQAESTFTLRPSCARRRRLVGEEDGGAGSIILVEEQVPSAAPASVPTVTPSASPTALPTAPGESASPSTTPSAMPTYAPTETPTGFPTAAPTGPTGSPTATPSNAPTLSETPLPTTSPTASPTVVPLPPFPPPAPPPYPPKSFKVQMKSKLSSAVLQVVVPVEFAQAVFNSVLEQIDTEEGVSAQVEVSIHEKTTVEIAAVGKSLSELLQIRSNVEASVCAGCTFCNVTLVRNGEVIQGRRRLAEDDDTSIDVDRDYPLVTNDTESTAATTVGDAFSQALVNETGVNVTSTETTDLEATTDVEQTGSPEETTLDEELVGGATIALILDAIGADLGLSASAVTLEAEVFAPPPPPPPPPDPPPSPPPAPPPPPSPPSAPPGHPPTASPTASPTVEGATPSPTTSPTTAVPTASPTTAMPTVSPTVFYDASATDAHLIGFTIAEDLSNINQDLLGAEIGNAACDTAGLPNEACTVAFAAGSVQVTLTMYAVGSVTLSSIAAVADAGFGNATAMQAFLEAATGTLFTVSGYTAVSATAGGASGGGGTSTAALSLFIIVGIVIGALVGIVLVGALVYIVKRRASPKVAPWQGEDGGNKAKPRKGKGRSTETHPVDAPPSPTDVERIATEGM